MSKVLGLGNALVDVLIRLDDDKSLEELKLPKGSMQLVDEQRSAEILEYIKDYEKALNSGGSAANTIQGVARLGAGSGYIGAIGKDEYGKHFEKDLLDNGITPFLNYMETRTGYATAFISMDSERTFATYLGAALEINSDMLSEDQFKGYDYFHFEGYLVPDHKLVRKALELAKANNAMVSIDMASYNIVEENVEFLRELIPEYVDIVFANEEEARALTGKEPEDALLEISEMCNIAVVKIGSKGSLVKRRENIYRVGVIDVDSIDTTGAGDLYAAGFIYGLMKNLALDKCGNLGAILSGKTIEIVGARMDKPHWNATLDLVKKELKESV